MSIVSVSSFQGALNVKVDVDGLQSDLDRARRDDRICWAPSPQKIEDSTLRDYMRYIQQEKKQAFSHYDSLLRWSVANKEEFWDSIWDYCGIVGEKGARIFDDNNGWMCGARFYPEGRLNYAQNLLEKMCEGDDERTQAAMIFRDEKGHESQMTRAQLIAKVSQWQQAMKDMGIVEGDRVAGYMPNMMETVVVALAAISLGAIWSSASPDFGVQGVLDRFGQIEPKLLIGVDGYYYNGKVVDVLTKIQDIAVQIEGLEKVVVVPFAGSSLSLEECSDLAVSADDFVSSYDGSQPLEYAHVPFNHPLFIMFSSGTTGIPKCIVHGHGGTLLQHLKEHRLHCDIKPGDAVFYFTTCGWMMWNWLISALASQATLLLYDGSPFYPDASVLWDYTSAHQCSLFGTSAKYIEAMKVYKLHPAKTHDLSALKLITSTGSPLVHESFDYIYGDIKDDVHVASISGGTDIVSCFVLGNPISPVYRGEIQGPGLGLAVDVYDDNGQPVAPGGVGELVCTKAFPCMPVSFWNDEEGARYKSAYFDRFENIWVHGDWVKKTRNKGFIILGRSDATLNPGGVRIGTAEIYRQLDQIEEVHDSVVIGQEWKSDVRVVLFVVLAPGAALDDALKDRIKSHIRKGASARHVPKKIVAVRDIPRTKSGKITEIAVRDVVMGRAVKNVEALANPESLELFKDLRELR
ncbi:MAG: acetoacetate--CoA ligase [Alphaproteobacteria bacterium]